jgi:hypothetical protein
VRADQVPDGETVLKQLGVGLVELGQDRMAVHQCRQGVLIGAPLPGGEATGREREWKNDGTIDAHGLLQS